MRKRNGLGIHQLRGSLIADWKGVPKRNKVLYAACLILSLIAILSLPPALGGYGLLTPWSATTFVHSTRTPNPIGGSYYYLEETAIELIAHGPLSAGVPLTASIAVTFSNSNLNLAGYPAPTFVSVVLRGAYLDPPQTDSLGNPTWAWISLKQMINSGGIDSWTNQSVTIIYYDSGSWGHDLIFGPVPCQDYCSFWTPDTDTVFWLNDSTPYGAVVEPYSVAVGVETNSLVVSFTVFITVLALLDLRVKPRLAD
jgi:hypothetical protein